MSTQSSTLSFALGKLSTFKKKRKQQTKNQPQITSFNYT